MGAFVPFARLPRGLAPTCATVTARPPGSIRRLRVLSVADPQATPGTAGRMVISGRMADVCAELDRLASIERPISPG